MNARLLSAAAALGALLAASARAADTSDPAPPIRPQAEKAAGERWGYVILSSDERHDGLIATTPGKPIRILDRKKSAYRDVAFDRIETIEQAPDREWFEQEWRWLEGGNDEKVYTDRFYAAAEYSTTITLKSGEKITGDAVAPIFVQTEKERLALELHQRFKSPAPALKKDLKPLIYVRKLVLTDEPPKAKDEPKK